MGKKIEDCKKKNNGHHKEGHSIGGYQGRNPVYCVCADCGKVYERPATGKEIRHYDETLHSRITI